MVPVMHHHIPRSSARLPLLVWYKCSAANVWLQWVSMSKDARKALVLLGKESFTNAHSPRQCSIPGSFVSSLTAVRDRHGRCNKGTRFAGGHERWKECSERARFVAE